ncbi:hypothetical protein ULMS_10010 [Patiriisocius marinistellae]|uniref:DUF4230 domain-containing protein n=1 Tax=Patiriisocius marinistellae TaxID=2494560 RepID=A0A5J4FUJ8_9FLAO|nr:DUF4230 domain-containing protein [Patiriisocius marinistellae]GEQ85493.1 hypothetical protein ULMS_10010 [Patiriisocius marinistellae]
MRNIFFGIILCLVIVFGLRYCEHQKDNRQQLTESTALIEKQIRNVGKLVVTEGSYSQVFSYKDTKSLLMGLVDTQKKALVIVNAEASISYDLSKIETLVDPETKTVTIIKVPEPELKINPNIEYYDVKQDYLNQFNATDYNTIKKRVSASLKQKIEASALKSNAQNRLISELQKIYILTNSMGWTLQFNGATITENVDLQNMDSIL